MMKKIISVCFLLLIAAFVPTSVLADEIIDDQGNVIPCKIETVADGLIEYHKSGVLYTFAREESSPVFNDYVDVRMNLLKKDLITRVPGKIIIRDMWSVVLKNEDGKIDIPFYKVKSIGIYKPAE